MIMPLSPRKATFPWRVESQPETEFFCSHNKKKADFSQLKLVIHSSYHWTLHQKGIEITNAEHPLVKMASKDHSDISTC